MGWPADIPASAHVFVTDLPDTLAVTGEDGHHLSRVLRLRPGESVTAADGNGTWRPYRVATVEPSGTVELEATGGPDREPALTPRLAVAFALTKADKPDLVVQKLTELGVDRILPVLAERSVSRPKADRATVAVDRWRRIAREAGGQCRRATLPVVAPLAPIGSLAGQSGLLVAERGGSPAGSVGQPPGGELLVLVGPEGGLTDDELKRLDPWGRIDLGPHVLRAETAAIAAAAMLTAYRRPA
jgi:16S rRNA (uracil1498-N3)-methyltransferase